ncbi:uncharacterized protein LOC121393669 [Xenopus laevis]|uniref:Uncharacterized protein LOC121393669 n=1 Tax=Xenopus laevis TaxID=8355 RepID=A0A8J1KN26_XENLA|nr:uncharacterized protein LOC121393669 [Xenopus laevis]
MGAITGNRSTLKEKDVLPMRTEKLFPKMVVGFPGRSTILWPYAIFAPGNGGWVCQILILAGLEFLIVMLTTTCVYQPQDLPWCEQSSDQINVSRERSKRALSLQGDNLWEYMAKDVLNTSYMCLKDVLSAGELIETCFIAIPTPTTVLTATFQRKYNDSNVEDSDTETYIPVYAYVADQNATRKMKKSFLSLITHHITAADVCYNMTCDSVKIPACIMVKSINATSKAIASLLADFGDIRNAVVQNRAAIDYLLFKHNHGCQYFKGMCCFNLSDHSHAINQQLGILHSLVTNITEHKDEGWWDWLTSWIPDVGGWVQTVIEVVLVVIFCLIIIQCLPSLISMCIPKQ